MVDGGSDDHYAFEKLLFGRNTKDFHSHRNLQYRIVESDRRGIGSGHSEGSDGKVAEFVVGKIGAQFPPVRAQDGAMA